MDEKEMVSIQRMFIDLSHTIFQKSYSTMLKMGIHPGQMPFFKILSKEGGLSQREIAQRLHVSPPSVAVSLKRMEKNGYVERRPDERDQRVTRIYLTEKGADINVQMKEFLLENEKELLRGFEEGEIYLLRRFFQQMIKNLEETMPKGEGQMPIEKETEKGEDRKV